MVTRGALKRLWTDRMTVTEYREVPKPNGSTGFEEVVVLEDVPCKLSFSTLQAVNQNDANATLVQVAKVFCDSALQIRAGSKLTVLHRGQVSEFSRSGEPGRFTVHQELVLLPFRGWA